MLTSLPPFPRARGELLDDALLHPLGIRIRRAAHADLPALARIHAQWRQKDLLLAPWTAQQKQWFADDQFRLQHLHYVRHRPGADFCVILSTEPGDAPAMLGKLYLDRSGREWQIVDILLAPDAQGRGLGSALIAWIQQAARAAGAVSLELQVGADNPRAHALYRRLGFEDVPDGGGISRPMLWVPGAA